MLLALVFFVCQKLGLGGMFPTRYGPKSTISYVLSKKINVGHVNRKRCLLYLIQRLPPYMMGTCFSSISDWTTFTLGNLTEGNSEYWSGNWKFAVLDYENMNEFGLFRFSIPSFEVLNQPDLLQSGLLISVRN